MYGISTSNNIFFSYIYLQKLLYYKNIYFQINSKSHTELLNKKRIIFKT